MKIKYELKPLEEGDEEFIESRIREYDESIVPPVPGAEEEEIVLKITDGGGNVIAGCLLDIDRWKLADINVLWVDERYRRQGMASALIREAERIFREKGCKLSVLGTFDFQARPLYEKHGYTVCGVTEDWPKGHCNYAMRKRLDRPSQEYIPSTPQKEIEYEVKIGDEADAEVIGEGLGAYNRSQVFHERDFEAMGRKITDENGNLIAAYTGGFDEWSEAYFTVWVDEPYRRQGIGTYLLQEAERELREKGAYVILVWPFDWEAAFFEKNGFIVCSATEDCPDGHKFYGMKKLL